jgi:hypothetical protein
MFNKKVVGKKYGVMGRGAFPGERVGGRQRTVQGSGRVLRSALP